jgi:hypothetical protein
MVLVKCIRAIAVRVYARSCWQNRKLSPRNGSPKTFRLVNVLAIFLVAILSADLAAGSSGPRRWSADLGPFGFEVARSSSTSYPETQLAVSDHVVAVAIGNVDSSELQKSPGHPTFVSWNVILILFDSTSGKMLTKAGPWRADFGFRLLATANGNFVLQLRHYHIMDQMPSEDLHLISPSGQEIRVLTLPPAPRDPTNRPYFVLSSPSRRTFLVRHSLDDGEHYQLLDPDTLASGISWIGGTHDPLIVALSDKELLGLGDPSSGRPDTRNQSIHIRTIDGPWRSLSVLFDSGGLDHPEDITFLSDHLIAGIEPSLLSKPVDLILIQTGGTVVFSSTVQEHADLGSSVGPIQASADGRFFAIVESPISWLWRQLDMVLWPDDLYVVIWSASNPTPVKKLNLGPQPNGVIGGFSLSPDGSLVAVVKRGKVEVVRLIGRTK